MKENIKEFIKGAAVATVGLFLTIQGLVGIGKGLDMLRAYLLPRIGQSLTRDVIFCLLYGTLIGVVWMIYKYYIRKFDRELERIRTEKSQEQKKIENIRELRDKRG